MKKLSIFLLLYMVAVTMSCYDDRSNTDFKIVNPIVIDFGGAVTSMNVFQFDTLKVNPMIYKNGVLDNNMTYEWKMQGNGFPETVLSNKMTFREPIPAAPNSKPYDLVLTVTDKTTGIQEFARVSITVQTPLGSGLLVADTRDGNTSDVSLIRAMNFSTRNFTDKDTRIFRNVYSSVNQHGVNGVIKDMQSLIRSSGNNACRTLTFVTDENIYRVDPYEFVDWEMNNDLFYLEIAEEDWRPVGITKWGYRNMEYLNVNGKIYWRGTSWGNLYYNFYCLTPDMSDYRVSTMSICGPALYSSPFAFDESENRFLQMDSWGESFVYLPKQSSAALFNVNNVGNYDAVWMAEGQNSQLLTVFKAEQGNEWWLGKMNWSASEKMATGKYNLTNCPGINEAVGFAVSPISEDFYYATKDQIYTFNVNNSQETVEVVAESRYTVDRERDGEITSMELWRYEYAKMNVSDEYSSTGIRTQSAQNRMLVITTYKEDTGEGKVITIPITVLRSGTLEPNHDVHGRYDGFGRITKVTFNNAENY